MKYSQRKQNNKRIYTWYLTDDRFDEFGLCDNCQAEAPLADFETTVYSEGHLKRVTKPLCEMCANSETRTPEGRVANRTANLILRKLGAFDDCEVVLAMQEKELGA